MAWDPAQYLKFADHRLRPAVDLLNRVDLDDPGEIYDLGRGRRQRDPPHQGALAGRPGDRRGRLGGDAGQGRGDRALDHLAAGGPGHLATGPAGRPDLLQRRAALAARPRAPLPGAAGRPGAGRRARGPDAAELRRPLPHRDRGGRAGRALARHARAAAAAGAGGRSRLLLRRARSARGRARHLGDRVPPGARGAPTRSRSGPRGPGSSRCWTRSPSPSAPASRRPTPRWWRGPTRGDRTGAPCFRSGACSSWPGRARSPRDYEDRPDRRLLGEGAAGLRVEDLLRRPVLHRHHPGAHGRRRPPRVGRELPAVHPGLLRRAHPRRLPHPARAHGPADRGPGHRDRAGSPGPAGLHQGQPVRAGRARHHLVGARRQAPRAAAAPRPGRHRRPGGGRGRLRDPGLARPPHGEGPGCGRRGLPAGEAQVPSGVGSLHGGGGARRRSRT